MGEIFGKFTNFVTTESDPSDPHPLSRERKSVWKNVKVKPLQSAFPLQTEIAVRVGGVHWARGFVASGGRVAAVTGCTQPSAAASVGSLAEPMPRRPPCGQLGGLVPRRRPRIPSPVRQRGALTPGKGITTPSPGFEILGCPSDVVFTGKPKAWRGSRGRG